MVPTSLYATSGHTPDEPVDDVLGDFLPEESVSSWTVCCLFLTALDAMIHSVPKLLFWI